MAPRIRMQIVAAGEDDTPAAPVAAAPDTAAPAAAAPPPPAPVAGRFHVLIIVEGVETGDKRIFAADSLTWRDLPLPLMAKDTDEHGSFSADTKATLIGNIDTIERQGAEIHGWGAFLAEPEGDAARLIGLVQRGELRGVSADCDLVEFELLLPVAQPDPEPGDTIDPELGVPVEEGPDGEPVAVLTMDEPTLRVTAGRVMGATVVPFPALQEAFIEPDGATPTPAEQTAALVAAGMGAVLDPLLPTEQPERFVFPVIPPRAWFDVPEPAEPMPLTILDNGQVMGHLATWGSCHIGLAGECVEPPSSPSNYARFHVGECPVDDGGRVSVGRLTFGTGHADTSWDGRRALSHYDHTGTVAADVVARDGEHGIWLCGAARSTLTQAQVREVMSSPPSGDWRRFGQYLDLVGALCVNVPGFNTPRQQLVAAGWAQVRREEGLTETLLVSRPALARPGTLVQAPQLDPQLVRRLVDRLAASIGRSRQERVAQLAARVHGKG